MSDDTDETIDHIVDASPTPTAADLEDVTDPTLESMIRQVEESLDLVSHKLNGSGRIKNVENEKVRCSYMRCQVKLLKLLRELHEDREPAEMKARIKRIEEQREHATAGTASIDEVLDQ